MREGFEQRLRNYAQVVRDQHDVGGEVDLDFFNEPDIAELLDEYTHSERVTRKSQEDIVRLQEQKATIMRELQESLSALDEPTQEQAQTPGAYRVRTGEDGAFEAEKEGQVFKVSKGDILTDHEWGIAYHLDAHIPRAFRKRYLVECAKGKLRTLLDEQIRVDEEARIHRRRNLYRSGNFFHDLKDRDIEKHAGLIAEKMVRTHLKKLAIDFDMPYEVIEADLYQDTIEKIDFIIRHRARQRGVGVDAVSEVTGVQFTIRTDERSREEKQAALDAAAMRRREVDDVVLVQVPLHDVMNLLHQWKVSLRPGGPTSMWDASTRRAVVARVLEGVLSDEEYRAALAALPEG